MNILGYIIKLLFILTMVGCVYINTFNAKKKKRDKHEALANPKYNSRMAMKREVNDKSLYVKSSDHGSTNDNNYDLTNSHNYESKFLGLFRYSDNYVNKLIEREFR